HLRMLTFSITDGALPGNKGRGAVVRSVLRRAFRFGYQCFGQRQPFIWKLVPALVEHMGAAYPELRTNPGRVQDIIKDEEADFLRTIERGIELFEGYVARTKAIAEGAWVEVAKDFPKEELTDLPKHFLPPDEEASWYRRAGKNVIPAQAVFK